MLLELRLRITKPLLGDCRGRDMRKFKRTADGHRILWTAGRWEWALTNAAHSLHLDCDVNTISIPADFFAPSTRRCVRTWRDATGDKREDFESIPAGAIISIYPELPHESFPAGRKVPSMVELEQLVEYVGRTKGMSPWGSDWGYGQFAVESIGEAVTKDHFLTVRNSALPPEFLAEFIPMAREVRFLGKPLQSLNRNELLAIAASLISQQEKQL